MKKDMRIGFVLAVLMGAGLNASASITLDLDDATSRAMSGFKATVPNGAGSGTLNANELIGIYKFTASGDGIGTPFWSTCLSPLGLLDWNSHSPYVVYTFSQASPGRNPSNWASGDKGDAGIQNAQFLWRLYSSEIIASGNAQQGAGLAMAMYEALYDSTSYGQVAAGTGEFNVTQWAGGTGAGSAYSYYHAYLAGLSSWTDSAKADGSILRAGTYITGTDGKRTFVPISGAEQDLILNTTPVPEPTTIIAGALLLLPFGASTIRFVRKNRGA